MAHRKQFRVLVTGSRSWDNYTAIETVLTKIYKQLEPYGSALEPVLVHGTAPGADQSASEIWLRLGGAVEPHPADWERWGNSAGFVRNAEMVKSNIDLAISFAQLDVDGKASKGTAACKRLINKAGIKHWEITADAKITETVPGLCNFGGCTYLANHTAPKDHSWQK